MVALLSKRLSGDDPFLTGGGPSSMLENASSKSWKRMWCDEMRQKKTLRVCSHVSRGGARMNFVLRVLPSGYMLSLTDASLTYNA